MKRLPAIPGGLHPQHLALRYRLIANKGIQKEASRRSQRVFLGQVWIGRGGRRGWLRRGGVEEEKICRCSATLTVNSSRTIKDITSGISGMTTEWKMGAADLVMAAAGIERVNFRGQWIGSRR